MLDGINFGTFINHGFTHEKKVYNWQDLKVWMYPADMVGDDKVQSWTSRGSLIHSYIRFQNGPQYRPKTLIGQNELYGPGVANSFIFDSNSPVGYKFMHDGSPFTYYAVTRLDNKTATNNWVQGNANSPTTQSGFEVFEVYDSASSVRVNLNRLNASGTRLTTLQASLPTWPNEPKAYCFTHESGTCRAYFRDLLISTYNDVGTPSSANDGTISIGNVGGQGAFYLGGIHEIMIFTVAHDALQRQEVLDYLNNKYLLL